VICDPLAPRSADDAFTTPRHEPAREDADLLSGGGPFVDLFEVLRHEVACEVDLAGAGRSLLPAARA
jgi:hypothetical protein